MPLPVRPATSGPPSIIVVGSCNLDLIAYTEVLPAPGETVLALATAEIPGGKGANQAVAAARAGGRVELIGAVGTDPAGDRLVATLVDAGVGTDRLARVPVDTGTARITVDAAGQNTIVVAPGANSLASLAAQDTAAIARADVLLLQLELPIDVVSAAAGVAHHHGTVVVLTPAPAAPLPAELVGAVDLLLPNEGEACHLAGAAAVEAALEWMLERVPAAVVTQGARGCVYAERGGRRLAVPAPAVDAVDTTAAGDTFAGALAVTIGEGQDMGAGLRWATAAAALSVQRRGAAASAPTRAQIDAALAAAEPP